ncbi:MAG: VWA domain-containing protein [Chloroflexi bacterium]|nr:VWA domain-containing protein [Chloroflexota bacterium]
MPAKTSYYDRLKIPESATDEDIRKAYHNAARRLHPDVNVEAGATELFINIKEAYEILINSDKRAAYDGKVFREAKSPPPVRIDVYYSRAALMRMNEDQLHYALLEMEMLVDPVEDEDSSPPTNIALILDCSTSMQGARLDMVKGSAIEILRQLRPQDVLSVIAFNDQADVLLPSGPHSNNEKSEARIRMLQARGGTEIFQGLEAGLLEVRRSLHPSYINHIILITDGHTYGDEAACIELAHKAASLGIGISCLGIDHEWNDSFLDDLATRTGGSSFYIHKPRDIRKLLKQKLEGLGQVFAERINLDFRTGPGVKLRYAFRLKPEAGVLPTSPPLRLGNIPKGSRQRVLLEFLVAPISPNVEQVLLAEGDLTFDIPKRANSTYRIPVTLFRPAKATIKPEAPPHTIVQAMSRLTLYRMQEQAKMELTAGNYEEAAQRLQHVATHLLSQGENGLAKTVISEAQHIQHRQAFSQEGEKRIKYGTRGLLLPARQRKDEVS